jgi:stage III sporulation protein SpoIIIAA
MAISQNWTEQTVQRLLSRDLVGKDACLMLGGPDTGKTTLIAAIAKHMPTTNQIMTPQTKIHRP